MGKKQPCVKVGAKISVQTFLQNTFSSPDQTNQTGLVETGGENSSGIYELNFLMFSVSYFFFSDNYADDRTGPDVQTDPTRERS